MLFQCWPNVFDAGPTLKQHWLKHPCLLGWSPWFVQQFASVVRVEICTVVTVSTSSCGAGGGGRGYHHPCQGSRDSVSSIMHDVVRKNHEIAYNWGI